MPSGLRRTGSRRPPQVQTYQSITKSRTGVRLDPKVHRTPDSPSIPETRDGFFRAGALLTYRAQMTDPRPRDVLDDRCVLRVAAALASFRVRGQITVLDDAAQTARQAAGALGVELAQIANSLVFVARREDRIQPLLVVASGAHRVDTLRLADLLELSAISLADAEFVIEQTGFTIGGVAPIATTHPVETVVDVSLSRYGQVWAAAGHPQAVFPTSYDELLRLTGGQPAEVS